MIGRSRAATTDLILKAIALRSALSTSERVQTCNFHSNAIALIGKIQRTRGRSVLLIRALQRERLRRNRGLGLNVEPEIAK